MTENAYVLRDGFRMFCTEQIGAGIARKVFRSDLLPDYVIKTEENSGSFQNVLEWETWREVKDTKFAKWFAPCIEISSNGSVLVMKRTKPLTRDPEKMPAFFTDMKRTNYGMLGRQPVCHDYGMTLLMQVGLTTRMRKPAWWDAKG